MNIWQSINETWPCTTLHNNVHLTYIAVERRIVSSYVCCLSGLSGYLFSVLVKDFKL